MLIHITKLTDNRHRLAIVGPERLDDTLELETRSLLFHDVVHYGVEAEGPLERGFWGTLHSGVRLSELWDHTSRRDFGPDLAVAEALVGPLQSVLTGRLPVERFVGFARASGASFPVDEDFVQRVRARVGQVMGAWRATPFGGTLELSWPAEQAPRVLE